MMEIQSDGFERHKKAHLNRVKVAIRVRPMIAKEIINHQASCVQLMPDKQLIIGQERRYKFDNVFGQHSKQEKIYQQCIKDLTFGFFQGYNAAVLAYGQTGSGKTYTMGTNSNNIDKNEQGIIPRVIDHIFQEIDIRGNKCQFVVKVSFIQIYNQQIIDLLSNDNQIKSIRNKQSNNIIIREQKDGSISLQGMIEQIVDTSQQMITLLNHGNLHRTTAATMMNETSSRSHAIFTISIEQQINIIDNNNARQQGFITAKFFFVDLAGSERVKKTGASGITLKEGININLGLLQLGNVISALAVAEKKDTMNKFITFRNSKLTRILQDCLGGNSNTYMIACISPAQSNYEESLNTLKYATKAMNIKNKPVVNRDPHSALIIQLKQRIKELQIINLKLNQLLKQSGIAVTVDLPNISQKHECFAQLELNKLKVMYLQIERKNQQLNMQIYHEKKHQNELEIRNYELQRERDLLKSTVEDLKIKYPELHMIQQQKDRINLVENYLLKLNNLEAQICDKQNINNQMQVQYEKLRCLSQRDEKIIIQSNKQIHQLKKQNRLLKKKVINFHLQNNNESIQSEINKNQEQFIQEQQYEEEQQQSLQRDQTFTSQEKIYEKQKQQICADIEHVNRYIFEKQDHLADMTNQQVHLEYKLIEEMKQQYHHKINMLQKERNSLLRKGQQHKINSRIQSLQDELKQYRKKIKQQQKLQKEVNNKSNKIKNLDKEIKEFKMQKIQLTRKLKEDKENFNRFKQKRIKQLMLIKKQNQKKQFQIRKLQSQNKKHQQQSIKKTDEIKRISKINQVLKQLTKPLNKKQNKQKMLEVNNKSNNKMKQNIEKIINQCLRNILLNIDYDLQQEKIKLNCNNIEKQLKTLIHQESCQNLKLQRIKLRQQVENSQHLQTKQSEIVINITDLRQRIVNLEQNLQYCQIRYNQLQNSQRSSYNIQVEIIYNKNYNSIQCLRYLLLCLFQSVQLIFRENYQLKQNKQQILLEKIQRQNDIQELKEKIVAINQQHQQNLSKLREQMLIRGYDNVEEQEIQTNTNGINQINQKMLADKDQKRFEKKVLDLSKINRQLTSDLQIWRRKCTVIQEKYQNMRNLFNKDKFIGRPIRTDKDEQTNKLICNPNTRHESSIDQVNGLLEQFKPNIGVSGYKLKRNSNHNISDDQNYHGNLTDPNSYCNRIEFNKNKWECLNIIQAHNSPILTVTNYKGLLITGATKSVRLWDLQTNRMILQLSGSQVPSFVKNVNVCSDRQLLAIACDKNVYLWDLRMLHSAGVLRAHRQDVRCLHFWRDHLITAGKGLPNSNSLLAWDLRKLNCTTPCEQKQKNQDIFSMTSHENMLYYGTRNHRVRRMNLNNWQVLTPFQPPHMDTVTALAYIQNHLVSGSKDKNIRLWGLDSPIDNIKYTVHAFNDYINTVESDQNLPIFYAGARDGQIKVGTVYKNKIQLIGGIISHTQSVNAISSIQDTLGLIVTGSSDKTVKIWQPIKETQCHIRQNY